MDLIESSAGGDRAATKTLGYAAVAGLVTTTVVALSAPDRFGDWWALWTAIVAGLGAASGIFFAYGHHARRSLQRHSGRLRSDDVSAAAAVGFAIIVATVAAAASSPNSLLSSRGNALALVMFLGGYHAVAATRMIRRGARRLPMTDGSAVTKLHELSRTLRRLLLGGGAIVTLSVLGAGVSSQRQGQEASTESVILFGLAGSAVVALFYLPTAMVVRHRLEEVLDHLIPAATGGGGRQTLEVLRARREARELVLGEASVLGEFSGAILITTPLVSALASRALS